jgi:hypothetical protein
MTLLYFLPIYEALYVLQESTSINLLGEKNNFNKLKGQNMSKVLVGKCYKKFIRFSKKCFQSRNCLENNTLVLLNEQDVD